MGSYRSKNWTVEKAESAVKAVFFMHADARVRGLPKLAYKDIKATIKETGNPVGDTTLSRALKDLVSKGELGKTGERKQTRYSLKERPVSDLITVAASADRMAIETAAANVGAIADPDDGWTYYGVPAGLRYRVRPRLRREAWTFQERVDRILQAERERFIRRLLGRARGRLSNKELEAAARSLRYAFDTADELRIMTSAWAWTRAFLDRVAPGVIDVFKASWETAKSKAASYPRAVLHELALASGEPEDRLEDDLKNFLDRDERHQRAGRKLFDILPLRERERAAREFADLVMLSSSWCAVVR